MPIDGRTSESDEKSDQMTYIENDGALFRGKARALPEEVWSPARSAWKPYETQPKPVEWGTVISEEQAKAIMQESAA